MITIAIGIEEPTVTVEIHHKEKFYCHEIQCENLKIAQEVAETLRKGLQDKINMYK